MFPEQTANVWHSSGTLHESYWINEFPSSTWKEPLKSSWDCEFWKSILGLLSVTLSPWHIVGALGSLLSRRTWALKGGLCDPSPRCSPQTTACWLAVSNRAHVFSTQHLARVQAGLRTIKSQASSGCILDACFQWCFWLMASVLRIPWHWRRPPSSTQAHPECELGIPAGCGTSPCPWPGIRARACTSLSGEVLSTRHHDKSVSWEQRCQRNHGNRLHPLLLCLCVMGDGKHAALDSCPGLPATPRSYDYFKFQFYFYQSNICT